ncbi:hypothetical protein HPB52_009394 [Rhipicephalus sanguineus]|uniref:Tick transposon n=1 Tax=Rhipicephalus sanguineus TaxID=34632 RepID=A0A9D4SNA3_RHISA|nr:hypothetical protein HPB52_009394 [Rhipicephalus sanguineus]
MDGVGRVVATEALLIHPLAAARAYVKPLRVGNRSLPWKPTVKYLGLTIDHRLTWIPAAKAAAAQVTRVQGAISKLQQRGRGCSTKWALRLNQASASSVLLYAFPLVSLTPARRLHLEGLHRKALRAILGLPKCSPVAATLAEAGEWPLSLRMLQRALGHIDRLHRAADGRTLLERLRSQPRSRMGGLCQLYHQMVPDPPVPVARPPPHHRPPEGRCASPACSHCGDPETPEHLLCTCPGLAKERSTVTIAYRRQGLPATTLEHLLFPSRPHLPALRSLADFIEETGIAAYH